MSAAHLSIAAAVAVLVFWIVGAYNRMVALRTALVARFAPIDEACRQRQVLLDEQLACSRRPSPAPGRASKRCAPPADQFDAARELARVRPGAPSAISSLRVAEDILADARARLPVQSAAGDRPAAPQHAARRRATPRSATPATSSTQSVTAYNRAVGQFPTVLLARLFSFRPAATF